MPVAFPEPNTTASTARENVAKAYCKAFAAIDDEVCEKGEGYRLTGRFDSLRRSCEEAGILCHLFPYPVTVLPPEDPDISVVLKRAVNIARTADVIVLDWNLGMENSAAHALHVVQALADTAQVRFVMIYTQNPNLESIVEELQGKFASLKALDPPVPMPSPDDDEVLDSEQAEAVAAQGRKLDFQLDNKLFIFIRKKEDLLPGRIIEEVRDGLVKAFPGHLRWAGLEMAVRARELLPRVVASLPNNTDSPLLLQLLYQEEEEVAGQVADVLLDELRFAMRDQPLIVVSDHALFADLRQRMADLCNDQPRFRRVAQALKADILTKLDEAAQKTTEKKSLGKEELKAVGFLSYWAHADHAELKKIRAVREKCEHRVSNYFPYKHDKRGDACHAIVAYLEGKGEASLALPQYVSWSTVRESVLLFGKKFHPQPGSVMRKKDGAGVAPDWLLCVTPACDCYRPTGKGFLFVAGKTRASNAGSTESGVGRTQTCVAQKEVIWDSTHLVIVQISDTDAARLPGDQAINQLPDFEFSVEQATYEVAGILRSEFAARLLQRVWVHQGRLGVDTSEFVRLRRAE